ncbi:MAG: winged helix-turn-helix domain-containing protein [Candidatus Methanoperedens sp.]|nr:winged helix-turn-helix domain-containing protein [Candidatus Methanoperedens sp.]
MTYDLDKCNILIKYWQYANVLLLSLEELGGSAKRSRVLAHIDENKYLKLDEKDREIRVDNVKVWENDLSFIVDDLKKEGYMLKTEISSHGIWSITEKGKKSLRDSIDDYHSRDIEQTDYEHLSPDWFNKATSYIFNYY